MWIKLYLNIKRNKALKERKFLPLEKKDERGLYRSTSRKLMKIFSSLKLYENLLNFNYPTK